MERVPNLQQNDATEGESIQYVIQVPTETTLDQLRIIYAPVGAHSRLGDNTCPSCGKPVRAYWNFFSHKTSYLYCSDEQCNWSAEISMQT
jgi:hypothetical protein